MNVKKLGSNEAILQNELIRLLTAGNQLLSNRRVIFEMWCGNKRELLVIIFEKNIITHILNNV